jgi:hypothetical protein
MQSEGDPWTTTFYHRAIQTHIGRALRARYDLSQPMPDKLAQLVMQIDRRDERISEPGSPQGHSGRPLPETS